LTKKLLGSLELNRVYQRDCLEGMAMIPDKSVDMILCDLPYGTTACKWDTVIPFELLWQQYERIIKDNGAIVLTAAQPFTSALVMSNPKLFKYSWTWDKVRATNHLNSRKQPLRVTEDILVFYKKQCTYNPILREQGKDKLYDTGKAYSGKNNQTYGKTKENYTFNSGREIPLDKRYPIDLITFSQIGTFGNKRIHPTQKPTELFEYLIKTYTNEGEIVLDNCMGSGTTAVAAIRTNRNFIGFERELEYVKVANQRLDAVRDDIAERKLTD
jgi:site-specific DNA-methyltransferase (adenine-specific)